MDAQFDFSNQLATLQQLYLSDDETAFQHLLHELEFKTYTQPVLFAQLITQTFKLLYLAQSHHTLLTAVLYRFIYNNYIVLSHAQLAEILSIIEHNYAYYQHRFVQSAISELLGEKFADKGSLHLTLRLLQKLRGESRTLIPSVLEHHVLGSTNIAIKKQALQALRNLLNDNHHKTRSETQLSLNRIEKRLNMRIYRSIC